VAKKKAAVIVDPVTRYARDVVAGRIVASRPVVQACRRHLDDLKTGPARGLEWRADEAQRVIDFFAEVLCLPEDEDAGDDDAETSPASDEPTPFVLAPFQQFIAGSLFGWYTTKGFRRFKEAYIETGKGSGKTPFGAGLALYVLVADGGRGAQVYAAATMKDQAKLAFTDAERMVQASPELRSAIDQKVNNLAVVEAGSFFRPISSEHRGLDGKRVNFALVDELHEHPNATVVNKMRRGIKNRRNALIVKITNSGFDRTSVCWQHHEYSRKVLDATVQADSWFAFICGLDPCDEHKHLWFPQDDCPHCDDWRTEGPHWLKANPNLGVSLPWDYLRDLVNQAKGMPSEVSDLLRFNFCVWTQGANRAIDMGKWANCQPMPNDHELAGADVYGGLDLGESDDLSAWARLYVLDDDRVVVKMRFWIPEAAIERFPNRPYQEWQRTKLPDDRPLLEVTEGDVTDYAVMQEQIIADCEADGVIAIAYDPRSATETAQKLQGAGITMIKTQQGFALHEAIKKLQELIAGGELCHGANPILTWMASNTVVLTGRKNEKRLAKEKSPEKIDGIAALVTGIDWAIVRRERETETEGSVEVWA
jgi:phage terminase large subunit-like protein